MSSEHGTYRLSPDANHLLREIAQKKNQSETTVLESLVRAEAIEMLVVEPDHPEITFGDLLKIVQDWNVTPAPDYTRDIFKRIETDEEARELYDRAISATPGVVDRNRKLSVNQRLGKFCKTLMGEDWENDEEVQVAAGTALIRSYTRFRPVPGGTR